ERQGTADVQEATAATKGGATGRLAGFNCHAGDGDGDCFLVLADVKYPAGVVAADGQQTGARPLDVQALADGQLAAGQRDRLAVQARCEDDRVAAVGFLDRVPQRPRPLVERVQDGQGAGSGAVFEDFEPRREGPP